MTNNQAPISHAHITNMIAPSLKTPGHANPPPLQCHFFRVASRRGGGGGWEGAAEKHCACRRLWEGFSEHVGADGLGFDSAAQEEDPKP